MKILLTGANGYIGKRLLPVLIQEGHDVVCLVRDKKRFDKDRYTNRVKVLELDLLNDPDTSKFPENIDAAYYLVHSMASTTEDFEELEARSARNFIHYLNHSKARQIIYLSGIVNSEKLSRHLRSRKNVEDILKSGRVPLTVLRAGIIVGSGSASFEIIRDLVEKLPLMVAPRWLNTRSQPIAIRDVIKFLTEVVNKEECFSQSFDIGGPEILTYKQMLSQYAEVRKLRRLIITIPVMTPRLSSYWLYFITSTSYKLAVNLVNSMKVDIICKDKRLESILKIKPITYKEAISLAFDKIEQNLVMSSWIDALASSSKLGSLSKFIEVPAFGCFKDVQKFPVEDKDEERVINNIWSIGGNKGWYYGNFLWKVRGFLDKMVGGTGLRRGRKHPNEIYPGDALDFWRVLIADKKEKRLLLYAEMMLPGEAWLEFRIADEDEGQYLLQTATFRPNGLWGRMYWYLVIPFHYFIFRGMARKIISSGR